MFVPIGHDRDTLRRAPVISFALIGITIATFLSTGAGRDLSLRDDRVDEVGWRVLEHLYDHPYLRVDPSALDVQFIGSRRLGSFLETRDSNRPAWLPEPEVRARAQIEMDRLTDLLIDRYTEMTAVRWGLMPKAVTTAGLLGHMFLHAGWFHLLGNLLILYLAGPFLEDVWGRPAFLFFYLAAGMIGGLLYAAAATNPDLPMVGASGAVAGLMGAFLLRYSSTRIRFVYVWGILAGGAVSVPAWIVLSLWFGEQVLFALFSDDGAGVAYLAHVGGFSWGLAVAISMRLFDIEERFLAPGIARKTQRVVVEKPEIDRALSLHEAGHPEAALRALERRLAARPDDRDGALAYWSIAVELGREKEAVPVLLSLIRTELRTGQLDLAAIHWRELSLRAPEIRLDPVDTVALVRALVQRRCFRDARALLLPLVEGEAEGINAVRLLAIARMTRDWEPELAHAALERVLATPEPKREVRDEAERLLDLVRSETGSVLT